MDADTLSNMGDGTSAASMARETTPAVEMDEAQTDDIWNPRAGTPTEDFDRGKIWEVISREREAGSEAELRYAKDRAKELALHSHVMAKATSTRQEYAALKARLMHIDNYTMRERYRRPQVLEEWKVAKLPSLPVRPSGYQGWLSRTWKAYLAADTLRTFVPQPDYVMQPEFVKFEKALDQYNKDVAATMPLLKEALTTAEKELEVEIQAREAAEEAKRRKRPGYQAEADIFLPYGIPAMPGQLVDPTAPVIRRPWVVKTYFLVNPAGSDEPVLITSNVDYVPRPPPEEPPILRIDGRFGAREESALSQWHVPGRWHMAFIPTTLDGRVHTKYHNSLDKDMAWYNFSARHFIAREVMQQKTFRASPELAKAVRKTWDETWEDWHKVLKAATANGQRPAAGGQAPPGGAVSAAGTALGHLLKHELSEVEVRTTLAQWQRAVLEMRGWCSYSRELERVEFIERSMGKSMPILPSADTGNPKIRKAARGVWTYHQRVADRIAQFGVPVWLVKGWQKNHVLHHSWTPMIAREYIYESRRWVGEAAVGAFANSYDSNRGQIAPTEESTRGATVDDFDLNDGEDVPMHDDEPVPEPGGEHGASTSARRTAEVVTGSMEGKKQEVEGTGEKRKAKGGVTGKSKRARGVVKPKNAPRFEWQNGGPPDWFPLAWSPAVEYVRGVRQDEERRAEVSLYSDDKVPEILREQALELRVPKPQQLANVATRNQSQMFATLCDLLGPWTTVLASHPVAEVRGFSAHDWKEIVKGFVYDDDVERFAQRLGIAGRRKEIQSIAVNVEDNATLRLQASSTQALRGMKTVEGSSSSGSPRSTVASFSPANTPATSRGASPTLTPFDPYGDDDDDDDDDEAGPAPFDRKCVYTRPTRAAERALATEEERYLYEPTGWRIVNAQRNTRATRHFRFFLEDDEGDDGTAELVLIGHTNPDFGEAVRTSDAWWCYDHGVVLLFKREVDPAGRLAYGERLLKTVRLFRFEGSRSSKTTLLMKELRVWHAEDLTTPLRIPLHPVGPIGSRSLDTASRNVQETFYLAADIVRQVYPTLQQFYKAGKWCTPPESPHATAPNVGAGPGETSSSRDSGETSGGGHAQGASSSKRRGKDKDQSNKISLTNYYAGPGPRWINGHEMPPYMPGEEETYEWPPTPWKKYVAWFLLEMTFRYEVFAMDDLIRRSHPLRFVHASQGLQRQQEVCGIWNSTAFVADEENPLVAERWEDRLEAVQRFHAVMAQWPRVSVIVPPAWTKGAFLAFEEKVWLAYAQTYFDYFAHEAPLPSPCPALPWAA